MVEPTPLFSVFRGVATLTRTPVTAVIPAFNEESTIGAVLSVLLPITELTGILVVDDGSTDSTADVVRGYCARDPRIRLIQLVPNGGKARAMLAGVEHAVDDLILFLDADLVGVTPDHIRALLDPVLRGDAEMAIARFVKGRLPTDWSHRLAPFLSGQRCLRWSRFAGLAGFSESGWSVEVGLSLHAWHQGYRVARVPWPGVTHRMRQEKRPGLSGYWSHVRMWTDIGRYLLHQGGLWPVSRSAAGERPKGTQPGLVTSTYSRGHKRPTHTH